MSRLCVRVLSSCCPCCCPPAALANAVSSSCPVVLWPRWPVLLLSSGRAGQPCVLLLSFSYSPLVLLLSCCCVLHLLSSVVLMSSCCRALYAAVRGREQRFLLTNLFGVYACIILVRRQTSGCPSPTRSLTTSLHRSLN